MSERILVIDDDEDSLKMISLMLLKEGYKILTASAGNPGLKTAFGERPDLILLDVMMPDMDGLEVCRRLRAESTTAETPIIMFTAKTLVEDKLAGFEAGVTDYLTKPIHPAELAARVKSVLKTVPRAEKAPEEPELPISEHGQSIGFVGAKGGIGTTSLAAAVGAILAKSQTTILTDIRPSQGTLGALLGISGSGGVSSVLKLPVDQINSTTIAKHLVNHSSSMQLLLSLPDQQEAASNYSPDSILALKKALEAQAHFCLFDLGVGLNRTTVPLMRELDKIVVLTESNSINLTSATSILTALGTRIPKEKIQLVITNRIESSSQKPLQEIESQLEHKITAAISSAPDIAYQATEAGMTLTQFQPDAAIAQEISKFVSELVKPAS